MLVQSSGSQGTRAAAVPPVSEPKPKAPRRRASTARKPPAVAAEAAPAAPKRKRAPAKPRATRSKAAVARLESAVGELEEILNQPAVAEPPPPAAPVPPPPPPSAPVEISEGAAKPALATATFLALVATLIVGYSAGYAVGTGSIEEPLGTVASAATRPLEVPVEAEVSETPAPAVAEALKPEPTESAEGLHLQVSALSSREAAAELGRRLESEGYPVQVSEPEGDGLVRVLVGPVAPGEDISEIADRLRAEGLRPFPKRL